jgi:hypothetical protein
MSLQKLVESRRKKMYKTIEAVYRDGAVFPLKEEIPVKYARILITIL